MTEENNGQLIKTMTSLMLIHYQYHQYGCLCIQTVADQVKKPLLKKGLQMFVNGRDDENIKDTLSAEVGSSDTYQNLVVEGVCMLTSSEPAAVLEEPPGVIAIFALPQSTVSK